MHLSRRSPRTHQGMRPQQPQTLPPLQGHGRLPLCHEGRGPGAHESAGRGLRLALLRGLGGAWLRTACETPWRRRPLPRFVNTPSPAPSTKQKPKKLHLQKKHRSFHGMAVMKMEIKIEPMAEWELSKKMPQLLERKHCGSMPLHKCAKMNAKISVHDEEGDTQAYRGCGIPSSSFCSDLCRAGGAACRSRSLGLLRPVLWVQRPQVLTLALLFSPRKGGVGGGVL